MNALVIWGISQVLPQYITITGGVLAYVIPGLVFGILNAIFKPILKFFSLPLIVLTAGLFSIVINAIILYALEMIVNIFKVVEMTFQINGGLVSYVITAFVLAVMNEITHWLINK